MDRSPPHTMVTRHQAFYPVVSLVLSLAAGAIYTGIVVSAVGGVPC